MLTSQSERIRSVIRFNSVKEYVLVVRAGGTVEKSITYGQIFDGRGCLISVCLGHVFFRGIWLYIEASLPRRRHSEVSTVDGMA